MLTAIIVIAAAYLVLHLGAGHARYRYRRRRYGRRGIGVYWNSAMRGPWVSIPLPFGFRLGRRLSTEVQQLADRMRRLAGVPGLAEAARSCSSPAGFGNLSSCGFCPACAGHLRSCSAWPRHSRSWLRSHCT